MSPQGETRNQGQQQQDRLGLETGRTPTLSCVLLQGKQGLVRAETGSRTLDCAGSIPMKILESSDSVTEGYRFV